MAIQPSEFLSTLSPSQLAVVLGMTGDMTLSFSNTSTLDAGYNLSAQVTLPDGVSYDSSTIAPTSIEDGSSGTIILKWTNIKDLSPQELGYSIGLTLMSDDTFRETGDPVPFDTVISGIQMISTVDTLPRGNDDAGNEIRTNTDDSTFLPLRYNLTKSAPSKAVKGASDFVSPDPANFPFQYTLTIENNSRSSSNITLIDDLPNGIRYLNNLSVAGPDSIALSSPTIILPSVSQDFTTLDWGTVTLSADSVNTITFDAAIWDRYTVNGVENSGDIITHMTPLENTAELDGLSGHTAATTTTNAMDATIRKSVSPAFTDVGQILNYTLTYAISQYYDIDDFTIVDITADGQTYNNDASVTPFSFVENPDGTTRIEWQLGNLTASTTGTITFTTTVDATYFDGAPVASNDVIGNTANSNGINAALLTNVPDSSSSSSEIAQPTINKVVNGYYYKDGTAKTYDVASPDDLIDFTITFDSTGLTADQLNVKIDEYAPLNMGPLVDTLPVTYGGTLGTSFTPVTITPNGLRWNLGNLDGGNLWTATFRIPVDDTVVVGSKNNLAKLSFNNSSGLAYSNRDQVSINFGEPEIEFEKAVSPLTNPVRPGETYTYSITISNLQNINGTVTDAFNMALTDVIPTGMTYTGTSSVTGTGSHDAPVFSGQDVSMLITQLAPNQALTLNYEVIVDIGVPSGAVLTNNAILQQPYSQADNSFQYPGDPFMSSVTKDVVEVTIDKTADITEGLVGDDINYTLKVTIPADTTVYTPQITDVLPTEQTFTAGSATREVVPGAPVSVTPGGSGQTLIFTNSDITPTGSDVVIVYKFVARITSGLHSGTFTQVQTNNTDVQWAIESAGPLIRTDTDTYDITVKTPNLEVIKEQRNFTQGGAYTTNDISVEALDIIHYKLTITSNGASPAYAISLNDILSDGVSYEGIISGPSVGTITPPSSPPNATLVWDIPQLNNGDAATVEFSVKFTSSPGAGENIINSAKSEYYSNDVNPIQYTADSNEVTAIAPILELIKTSSKLSLNVGDTLTYILTLTIPPNVTAYNVVVSDTLPPEQTYAGNAKRNYFSVTPSVVGQLVTFDTEPVLGPYTEAKTFIYSFNSTVISAVPPYPQTQTNSSEINWDITPTGTPADPVNSNLDIEVFEELPYRGISIDDTISIDFNNEIEWDKSQ